MSSAPARLLFVLALSLNFIIWSQSRFAYHGQSSLLRRNQSHVKRFLPELLNPNTPVALDAPEKEVRVRVSMLLPVCDMFTSVPTAGFPSARSV